MMNFVLRMMDFVSKMMKFVFKMMDFVSKMAEADAEEARHRYNTDPTPRNMCTQFKLGDSRKLGDFSDISGSFSPRNGWIWNGLSSFLLICAGVGTKQTVARLSVNFALKMMNFASEMMNFVSKMMNFVPKMMNFVPKMMNFVSKMMNFVPKMMNFVSWDRTEEPARKSTHQSPP